MTLRAVALYEILGSLCNKNHRFSLGSCRESKTSKTLRGFVKNFMEVPQRNKECNSFYE